MLCLNEADVDDVVEVVGLEEDRAVVDVPVPATADGDEKLKLLGKATPLVAVCVAYAETIATVPLMTRR